MKHLKGELIEEQQFELVVAPLRDGFKAYEREWDDPLFDESLLAEELAERLDKSVAQRSRPSHFSHIREDIFDFAEQLQQRFYDARSIAARLPTQSAAEFMKEFERKVAELPVSQAVTLNLESLLPQPNLTMVTAPIGASTPIRPVTIPSLMPPPALTVRPVTESPSYQPSSVGNESILYSNNVTYTTPTTRVTITPNNPGYVDLRMPSYLPSEISRTPLPPGQRSVHGLFSAVDNTIHNTVEADTTYGADDSFIQAMAEIPSPIQRKRPRTVNGLPQYPANGPRDAC